MCPTAVPQISSSSSALFDVSLSLSVSLPHLRRRPRCLRPLPLRATTTTTTEESARTTCCTETTRTKIYQRRSKHSSHSSKNTLHTITYTNNNCVGSFMHACMHAFPNGQKPLLTYSSRIGTVCTVLKHEVLHASDFRRFWRQPIGTAR